MTIFLSLSRCGCMLCCNDCNCRDPIGQASFSLSVSAVLFFFSVPLFMWNIGLVATTLSDCRSTHLDACFTERDVHPYYCRMRLVRAGIGSMAGLSACVALILAGNTAYLGPAIRTRAAAPVPHPVAVIVLADHVDPPDVVVLSDTPHAVRPMASHPYQGLPQASA
jgi:hypothetical protein